MQSIQLSEVEKALENLPARLGINPVNGQRYAVSDCWRAVLKFYHQFNRFPSLDPQGMDKSDLLFLLRQQYYKDIEVSARLRAKQLRDNIPSLGSNQSR